MALVTVRSPSVAGSPQCSNSDSEAEDEEGGSKNGKSECFFAGKGTALVLALKDVPHYATERRLSTDSTRSSNSTQSNNSDIQQHLQSMFYLLRHEETLKMAVKLESQRPNRTRYLVIASRCCYRPSTTERKHRSLKNSITTRTSNTTATTTIITTTTTTTTTNTMRQATSSIDSNSNRLQQQQTQSTSIDTSSEYTTSEITATQLSSGNSTTSRAASAADGVEESCLLGIDCNERATIGLVVPILADTTIRLDGDGGFSVKVYNKTHIFKPVSVQAMWSALQTLHKVSQKARENNFYFGGPSHDWLSYYESRIESDQSCLNEWHAMDSLESRRPPSPDAIRNKPTAKEETESVIKMKLKEIMMSVDLDEVTSKYIRSRLEEHLDMDLGEYKEFIDAEMLTILGQMDAPTEIFEHVYLGSEWNASNLEELQKNGVRHILNVTREIDNFFPGMFDYFNVRVYDDEKTNLLKHWDNTYRYITRAKSEGSKVLVHCKMGVSRSASVVIAYAMKAYNWEFQQALQHVKERRSCIKPNKNFLNQLETYRGMLDAMKNKEKLQRSKSETNLKSSKDARLLPGSEPTPLIQALNQSKSKSAGYEVSSGDGNETPANETVQSDTISKHNSNVAVVGPPGGGDTVNTRQRRAIRRSSSSSPKTIQTQTTSASVVLVAKQQSQSLENLTPERSIADEPKNMRFPGSNGENYSVTQNQVLHIQKNTPPPTAANSELLKTPPSSVRTIIQDLETHRHGSAGATERKTVEDRKILNLPFSRSISHDAAAMGQKDDITAAAGSPVWTSSAKLITQTTNTNYKQEDKVMTEQQQKQQQQHLRRKTNSWTMSTQVGSSSQSSIDSTTTTATTLSNESAPVSNALYEGLMMRQRPRELPSRHASWGSGDQRGAVIPRMRNSSWSAYDTNRNNTNNLLSYNTTAIYEGQVQQDAIANELNTTSTTMSYKTAPTNLPAPTQQQPQQQLSYNMHSNTTAGGTVKRTKQKLEGRENNSTQKKLRNSSQNQTQNQQQQQQQQQQIDESLCGQRRTHLYRSASAAGATASAAAGNSRLNVLRHNSQEIVLPTSVDATNCDYETMSDIANKNIDNLESDEVILRDSSTMSLSEDQRISGNVQILKKNFEARASTTTQLTTATVTVTTTTTGTNTAAHQSLPSSPVAQHAEYRLSKIEQQQQQQQTNITTTSDASVKGLVHKYQSSNTSTTTTATTTTTMLNSITSSAVVSFKPRPRSYYDNILVHKTVSGASSGSGSAALTPLRHEYNENRPPPAPIKERAEQQLLTQQQPQPQQTQQQQQQQQQQTSSLSHRRLQQHGKTHPLSRLSLPKQNFNTAAYNTM